MPTSASYFGDYTPGGCGTLGVSGRIPSLTVCVCVCAGEWRLGAGGAAGLRERGSDSLSSIITPASQNCLICDFSQNQKNKLIF